MCILRLSSVLLDSLSNKPEQEEISHAMMHFIWTRARGLFNHCSTKHWSLTFCLSFSSFCLLVPPSCSPSGSAHRERVHGGPDVEDHRFRPGERVAQDHEDEHRRHLRLDGPRGHQVLDLLQGQWCLEVSVCVCVSNSVLRLLTPVLQSLSKAGVVIQWIWLNF